MGMVLKVEDLKRRNGNKPYRLKIQPDWFLREAAGIHIPQYPGLTMAEFRERKAKRWRAVKVALLILTAIGLLVMAWR